MVKEKYLIGLVALAIVIREVWTLHEWPAGLITPFPLSNQQISISSYLWIACGNIFMIIIYWVLYQYSDKAAGFFAMLFWFQFAEFIEYFVIYNEPWFKFNSIPVNVTTLRYVGILISGVYTLCKI